MKNLKLVWGVVVCLVGSGVYPGIGTAGVWQGPEQADPASVQPRRIVEGAIVEGVGAGGVVSEVAETLEQSQQRINSTAASMFPARPRHEAEIRIEEIENQLATVVEEFSFDQVPFRQVADFLQAELNCNVDIDQSALDDSLAWDTLVTCRYKYVSYDWFLRRMLKSFNATMVVDEGGLTVISLDVADSSEYLCTRVIDARQVIRLLQDYPQPEVEEMPEGQRPLTASERLLKQIKTVVAPDSWMDTQGEGVVWDYRGFLVVSQTRDNLLAIERLLRELEYVGTQGAAPVENGERP